MVFMPLYFITKSTVDVDESEASTENKYDAFPAFHLFISFTSIVLILYLHLQRYFKTIRNDAHRYGSYQSVIIYKLIIE